MLVIISCHASLTPPSHDPPVEAQADHKRNEIVHNSEKDRSQNRLCEGYTKQCIHPSHRGFLYAEASRHHRKVPRRNTNGKARHEDPKSKWIPNGVKTKPEGDHSEYPAS